MASSSLSIDDSVSVGDSLSVEVLETTGDIISVRFCISNKSYNGILLQENSSHNQHGINTERVRGAPFWPPLPTSSINLKTIPCSNERYTCKVEGQPSCLTVFQPEAVKRSNRAQPAPQLSRILRPRRFVCRKCKKAYHVEENGSEMSSSTLSAQLANDKAESGAVNSDSESYAAPSTSQARVLRRLHPASILNSNTETSSLSIRHVTPSIIPKLTEDFGLSGRESEAESNPDDTIVVKRKRVVKDKPTPIAAASVMVEKPIVSTKRKADPDTTTVQKAKKSKRLLRSTVPPDTVPIEPREQNNTQIKTDDNAVQSSNSVEHIPPPPIEPVNSVDSKPKENLLETSSELRKNRIKAQYGSVATPFRFPPSRSSKPDLFSISQMGSGQAKEKSHISVKRANKTEKQNRSDASIPSSPPLSDKQTVLSINTNEVPPDPLPSSPKKASVAGGTTRRRSGKQSTPSDKTGTTTNTAVGKTIKSTSASRMDSTTPNLDQSTVSLETLTGEPSTVGSIDQSNGATKLPTDGDNPIASSIPPSPCPIPIPNSDPSVTDSLTLTTSRVRATDYEKPKNRWIREARARRTPEERLGPASPGLVSSWTSNGSVSESTASVSTVSPSASHRLRVKSSESIGGTAQLSVNSSPKPVTSRRRNGTPVVVHLTDTEAPGAVVSAASASSEGVSLQLNVSPRPGAQMEPAVSSLPVLKIKINRQHAPLSSSSTDAQYQVVGRQLPQVTDLDAERATAVSCSKLETDETNGELDMGASESIASSPLSVSSSRPSGGGMGISGIPSLPLEDLGGSVRKCKLPDGVRFRVGNLVWSKLSGWPSWPAQITSIHQTGSIEGDASKPASDANTTIDSSNRSTDSQQSTTTKRSAYTACLHWFAWHQVSYMSCDKLFHFTEHYKRFDNKKKRGVFRQAVNEAMQKSKEPRNSVPTSSDSESGEEQLCISAQLDNTSLPIQPVEQTTLTIDAPIEIVPVPVCPDSFELKDTVEHQVEPTPIITLPLEVVVQSTPDPAATAKCPPLTVRAGRGRSLKGRRGAVTCQTDAVRTSPRNLPCFLSTGLYVDKTSPIRASASKRRPVSRGVGRGRGRSRRPSVGIQPTTISRVDLPSLPSTGAVSSGTLKMVLSTSRVKLLTPTGRAKRSVRRRSARGNRSLASKEIYTFDGGAPSPQPAPIVTHNPTKSPMLSNSIDVSANPVLPPVTQNQPAPVDAIFCDSSAEILSQFPQVFPDLRASGILSEAVDIPTFSEDESEGEDDGRLIIDPEVMASVNATPVPIMTEPTPPLGLYSKLNPHSGPHEAFYRTNPYAASNAVHSAVQSIQSQLLATNPSGLPHTLFAPSGALGQSVHDPTQHIPAASLFNSQSHHNLCVGANGFPSHASRVLSSASVTGAMTTTATMPIGSQNPQRLVFEDQPSLLEHRLSSSFFRPSSHTTGVPVTASNTNVPYMTGDRNTMW